ncbi:CoxG family protein [Kurthia senegalensis]|uniref:CoxG family protein n=1 Tax=Kurthia senegalensis TaxID=1033740 RepID=UPI00028A100F|nr:SRPBCC family protein [Kurthia senegalensis]
MATTTYKTNITAPNEKVWQFVSNIENWASLVPGYRKHTMLNDKQSTWTFSGTVAGMTKTVEVQIDITDWEEPSKIGFVLQGLSDKFTGAGYFEATPVSATTTNMTMNLELKAGGIAGVALNPIFKIALPLAAEKLAGRVVTKIQNA